MGGHHHHTAHHAGEPIGYTIRLECCDGLTWGHIEVRRWSHVVARAARRELDQLVAEHRLILATVDEAHASGAAYELWRKLVRYLGFQFLATVTDERGVRRAIYARRG